MSKAGFQIDKVGSYRKPQRPTYKKRCHICGKNIVIQFQRGTPRDMVLTQGRAEFQKHLDTHKRQREEERSREGAGGGGAWGGRGSFETHKVDRRSVKEQPTYRKRCLICGKKLVFRFAWGTPKEVVIEEGRKRFEEHEERCRKAHPGKSVGG